MSASWLQPPRGLAASGPKPGRAPAALRPILGLTLGEPSDAGLTSLDGYEGGDPDHASAGAIYGNAVSAIGPELARKAEAIVKGHWANSAFTWIITRQPLHDHDLHAAFRRRRGRRRARGQPEDRRRFPLGGISAVPPGRGHEAARAAPRRSCAASRPHSIRSASSPPAATNHARRVKITGLGPVTPAGIGRESFFHGINESVSRVREVTRIDPRGGPFVAAQIEDFDLREWVSETGNPKRIPRQTQFALAGTALALEDAGISHGGAEGQVPGHRQRERAPGSRDHPAHVHRGRDQGAAVSPFPRRSTTPVQARSRTPSPICSEPSAARSRSTARAAPAWIPSATAGR
jgi:hypothetical protein